MTIHHPLPEGVSRGERREAQLARIIDAARACFLKSGFQGASMGDICAAAAMSPGALYRYFPSKEALIEAICEVHREEDARILMTMRDSPSIVDGIVRATLAHIRHVHEAGLAPLFSEIFAESMRNPQLAQTCERSMCNAREAFASALSQSLERGEIDPVVPLEPLLSVMMAFGHGLATHDLPRHGVGESLLEPMIRVMAAAMLRPTAHAGPPGQSA